MATIKYITVKEYCRHHKIEETFIQELCDQDVVQIEIIEKKKNIRYSDIPSIEKAIRLQRDFNINAPGISMIFSLLNRMQEQHNELKRIQNLLKFYDGKNS